MAPGPTDSLRDLFGRFLRFGLLAWGGPAAQIAMLREELVEKERWMEPKAFNRTLAVYQALPGPEATELCVHFGYLRRGRWGALVAGLGFILPGFILMLALSMAYVRWHGDSRFWAAALIGFPPAVAALVTRATFRLSAHSLHDKALVLIGAASLLATLQGVPFYAVLPLAGIAYLVFQQGQQVVVTSLVAALALTTLFLPAVAQVQGSGAGSHHVTVLGLGASGLKAGVLTFGGAYTVIPFLQQDSVGLHGWVTQAQFIDGIALSGILPAPLIIFSTFLGYLGGGLLGALVMTVAIFLPAFGFTMVGFRYFDRLVNAPNVHAFLDGVTAAVMGIIAVTAISLLVSLAGNWLQLAMFAVALAALFSWKRRFVVPVVVLACGMFGALVAWLAT